MKEEQSIWSLEAVSHWILSRLATLRKLENFCDFYFFIYLFIFFWLCTISVNLQAFAFQLYYNQTPLQQYSLKRPSALSSLSSQNFSLKKFLIFFLKKAHLKKFLIFSQKKLFLYFRKWNFLIFSYISENGTF